MMRRKNEGFTLIEVLITLFVAGVFLLSGYQLFGVITNHATEVREESEASNIAHMLLRQETYIAASKPCTTKDTPIKTLDKNAIDKEIGKPSTIKNISAKIFRCKPFSAADVMRVKIVVEYGAGREVAHATYLGQ